MGKSNYLGGSTVLHAHSGWFSPYRNNPNVDPVTGETRSELVQRRLAELEQSRQIREIQKQNEKILKSTNNKGKLKKSRIIKNSESEGNNLNLSVSDNLTAPKSIIQQEERMSKIQVEVRRKKKIKSK